MSGDEPPRETADTDGGNSDVELGDRSRSAGEAAWLTRRRVLQAAGTGALAGIAGCGGDPTTRRYEADPAGLSSEGRSMGYRLETRDTMTTEREESVAGSDLEVTIVSHLAAFEGEPDSVGCVSTPAAREAGQALNPLEDRPLEEILRNRADDFLSAVAGTDAGGGWESGPEQLRTFEVEVLENEATATAFAGTTNAGDAVLVSIVRVTHEGDVVFAGSGRAADFENPHETFVGPEGYFSESEFEAALESFGAIMPHVEHPKEGDGSATTPERDLSKSPFNEINVESLGGGYKRYTATVEVLAQGEGFTEKTIQLDDPKFRDLIDRRTPTGGSSGSPALGAAGGEDSVTTPATLVGDVPDDVTRLATAPIEDLLEGERPPPNASLRSDQTPLKWQGRRGTCVSFCVVSAMEAHLNRQGFPSRDLSEQYVNHITKMPLLQMLKGDSSKRECVDGKRNGPASTSQFENFLGMWGPTTIKSVLKNLESYGVPVERDALFQTSRTADRTYVKAGAYGDTSQSGDDPYAKLCNPGTASQREVNDFNVEHSAIQVPIGGKKNRTLRMRPFPREALKNANYQLDSYMFMGSGSKLEDPTWYEKMIGDVGREVIISFPSGACTVYHKERPKKKDYSSDSAWRSDFRQWKQNNGDVYSYDKNKGCGGWHCLLLVGYKRNANPPHFIAKNSWDTYTKIGYDVIKEGLVGGAGVVTGVSRRTGSLREQDFLGRWKLRYSGLKGTLDIYRKPGQYKPKKLGGAADRRIGTFFETNGSRELRVNGNMQPSLNKIDFSFESGGVLDYDETGSMQFTGYMDYSNRDFMAGTYTTGNDTYGFFAVPNTDAIRPGVVQYSSLRPESFLGEWLVESPAFDGVLEVDSVSGSGSFSGAMRRTDGTVKTTNGKQDHTDQNLVFAFPSGFGGWSFDGYIHTHNLAKISGVAQRIKNGGSQQVPMTLTRVGLADPTLKILQPVEGAELSGKSVRLEARVKGDPNPGPALIWTIDGPYDTGNQNAGRIIARGSPARGSVSSGEHTITATYTNTTPSKTDEVTITVQ